MRKTWTKLFLTGVVATVLLICSYTYLLKESGESQELVQPRFGLERIVAYAENFFPGVRKYHCPDLVSNSIHVVPHNVVWQTTTEGDVFLFSAYYDMRLGEKRHMVRVMSSTLGKLQFNTKLYCQLRYESGVEVVEADVTLIWSNIWDREHSQLYYWPYLLSCPVPEHQVPPLGVSIASSPCAAVQNRMDINPIDTAHKKHDFAVCVKGLDFSHDISPRLIEWIELQLILGTDLLNFYVYKVHPNVLRVLEHYQGLGKVHLQNITLPGRQPNEPGARTRFLNRNTWQKRRNELVPYNDCFYRHIHSHHFVVLLDLDEAIVPLRHNSWKELMSYAAVNQASAFQRYASFAVQNVYFFDEFPTSDNTSIPAGAHMMRHVIRSSNFSRPGFAVKSFLQTNLTLTAFNHYALTPLMPSVQRSILLSREVAQLHHYRAKCPPDMENECAKNFLRYRVKDTSLWKWKDNLINRIRTTTRLLNL